MKALYALNIFQFYENIWNMKFYKKREILLHMYVYDNAERLICIENRSQIKLLSLELKMHMHLKMPSAKRWHCVHMNIS